MSINTHINMLERQGNLRRFTPKGRLGAKRRLYLTAQAAKDFDDRSSAVNILVGHAYLVASMTRWASGGLVYGDERKGRFLTRLRPPPPEIWEVRVTEPSTQARLFGRFAAIDTLILTRFHTRRLLGNKGSAAWRDAMADSVGQWIELFGAIPPFGGRNVHDYISENCDDFPI